MSDLISRQAAIDALKRDEEYNEDIPERADGVRDAIITISGLPSAQPERAGRWIKVNGKTAINCSACYHCCWSLSFEDMVKRFNFCPNCGADMRGEEE